MNFHCPNWLYVAAIVVVGIIAVFVLASRRRKKDLEAFASAKLLPELSKTYSKTKYMLKCAMFALGCAIICIALARPQYGYRWEETKAKGVDIIFAIDTSKSMLAEDIIPNRLERSKLAVIDIARMLRGDRIGIVAFSGQAFLQCPLTLDYDAFRMSLDALDTNVIQRGGTNIASAITEAEVAFAKSSAKKIIILISDGEQLEADALSKAQEASKDGITIYTLGVGNIKGEVISITDERGRSTKLRDESGNIVKSKLNEVVLTKIAQATGGFYGALSTESVEKILNDGIKKSPEEELASRMKRTPIERFQIPLIIAIIFIALETLIGTRNFFVSRRSVNIAIVLVGILATMSDNNLYAQNSPKQPVQLKQEVPQKIEEIKPVKKEEPPKQPTAKDYFNQGIDAYNNQDYQNAQDLFEHSMKLAPEDYKLQANAIYNIANTKYKTAINPLVEAPIPAELMSKMQQASAQHTNITQIGKQLLQTGKPLLEKEQQMLKDAKNEEQKKQILKNSPLKNQQFQQQLQQAIMQCETLQKLPNDIENDSQKSKSAWQKAQDDVQTATNLYNDALTLNTNIAFAKENKEVADKTLSKLKNQTAQLDEIQKAVPSLREQIKSLEQLKEDLKKLVRNEDNQNNQQNQDNKQNQQNNQNKDNNQQNQQNKDNQQNQQQNKDNKDSDKKNKDNQSQSQKDKQNQNNPDENKKDKQNQDNNNKAQQNKNEQAVENKSKPNQNKNPKEQSQQQQKSESQKEQNKASAKEQATQKQKQEQSQQAKSGEEKAKENYRKAEGVMTKAEAKNLLESMKEDEKILPLRGFGEQKRRFEDSNYKDW